MHSNTTIAGYLYKGQYFCPSCAPQVKAHEALILRPGLALNYVKRKCEGTNCGNTLVFEPITKAVGKRLEVFAEFVNTLDF